MEKEKNCVKVRDKRTGMRRKELMNEGKRRK